MRVVEVGAIVCIFGTRVYKVVRLIDASEKLCGIAEEYIGHPFECVRFEVMKYEDLFDGIWACASLLHDEKKDLPDILRKFHRTLKPGVVMYASFKYGDKEEERLGRFFSDYHLEEVERIFMDDVGFEPIEGFETEDVRPDYTGNPWVNVIVQKNT